MDLKKLAATIGGISLLSALAHASARPVGGDVPPESARAAHPKEKPAPPYQGCPLVLSEAHHALASDYLAIYQGARARRAFEYELKKTVFFEYPRVSPLDGLGQGPPSGVDLEKIRTTLFVLPINDLESFAAARILKAVNAPYIWLSEQGWGAKLGQEMRHGLKDYLSRIPVRRIAIFEIPGEEDEETLRKMGKEVVIYDHHSYDSEGLNRYNEKSSLEQLCEDLHWNMSPAEKMVAVADRSFIPGLTKLGLTPTQIIELRALEAVLQRHYNRVEHYEQTVAQTAIHLLDGQSEVRTLADGRLFYISYEVRKETGVLYKNVLPSLSPGGVANILQTSVQNISFSGDPRIVEFLTSLDWPTRLGIPADRYKLYSGGDPETRFMNIRFDENDLYEVIRKRKIEDVSGFYEPLLRSIEQFALTLPPR